MQRVLVHKTSYVAHRLEVELETQKAERYADDPVIADRHAFNNRRGLILKKCE